MVVSFKLLHFGLNLYYKLFIEDDLLNINLLYICRRFTLLLKLCVIFKMFYYL